MNVTLHSPEWCVGCLSLSLLQGVTLCISGEVEVRVRYSRHGQRGQECMCEEEGTRRGTFCEFQIFVCLLSPGTSGASLEEESINAQ